MELAHVLARRGHRLRQGPLRRVVLLLLLWRSCVRQRVYLEGLRRDQLLVVLGLRLRRQGPSLVRSLEVPRILLGLHVPLIVVKSGRVRHLVRIRVLRAVQPVEPVVRLPVEPGLR